MTAKERRVAEQIAGNRYVGIHITLGMDEKEKRPMIHDVFPGGPAGRAGIKDGAVLEEVDGVAHQGHASCARSSTACAATRGPTSPSRSGSPRRRSPGR